MGRSEWSKETIIADVKAKEVRFIRRMFTDINGRIKYVEIPFSQLEKALDNKMTFDGSSMDGFVRIEVSSVDLSTNHYLALVRLLKAGLIGIELKIYPPEEVRENIYAMDDQARIEQGILTLPASLREAVDELEATPLILNSLGQHIADRFIMEKRLEYQY